MSPVKTKVEIREARGRAQSVIARAKKARQDRQRNLDLENLEVRALLATLPAMISSGSPSFIAGAGNSTNNLINDYQPTISINPNNPLQMVATYGVRNANIASPNSFFTVGARYSTDGGNNWNDINTLPAGNQTQIDNVGATPSTASPPPNYTQNDDLTVAWDTKNNFYILETQRTGDNASGAVFFQKYSFTGGVPTATNFPANAQPNAATPIGGHNYKVLYFWNQSNLPTNATSNQYPGVYDATMAIDTNARNINNLDVSVTDNFTDTITISWIEDTPPPSSPPSPWNRYTVEVLNSDNAGGTAFGINNNFSNWNGGNARGGATRISGGNVGTQLYSSPKIAISQQNTAAGITGGQVTVVYDDFGSAATASPPQDIIFAAKLNPRAGGGFASNSRTAVGTTAIRGNVSPSNYSFATSTTPKGIGPGIVVAADNSLGSFSPHAGRIYVAYVDHLDSTRFPALSGNEADNSDIFVKYSDDGGTTWNFENTDLFGDPIPSNDDHAVADGFTGAAGPADVGATGSGATAYRLSGRPQFQPNIAVDNTTGTLILSYYDARADASRARVNMTVQASIDGGQTWSPSVFANTSQQIVNAVNGTTLTLGAYPENQSGGNPNTDSDRSFGRYQSLVVSNGAAYLAWAGNLNGGSGGSELLGIEFAKVGFAAGPRILSSTMGPVKAQNDNGTLYNNTFAADGTQQFTGFGLTFDRAIDPTSFPSSAVTVTFTPANGGATVNIPVGTPVPVDSTDEQWFVPLVTAQSGVGSYTYSIQPVMMDMVRTFSTGGVLLSSGNLLDQNADGTPGAGADAYLVPRPLTGTSFAAPYDNTTLPIIVPGPHMIDSSLSGKSASTDNLALNSGVSSLDVTFDRNIVAGTFTNTDVLRIQGPQGVINGPTTFQAGPAYQATNLGGVIPDGTGATLDATMTIPSSAGTFKISNLSVNLSITQPNVSQLSIILIAPDGTQIPLVAQSTGSGANLTNTTFSDSGGLTFAQGIAPYTNTYRPASPLSVLNGKVIDGKWTLRIQDTIAGPSSSTPQTLNNWALVITPQITVTPVPVYDFQSPNVPAPSGTSTVSINPPVGSGANGANFTLAALKLKATLDVGVALTLTGPDGTVYNILNSTNATDIAVSIPTAIGKALKGTWTLTANGATINAWSLVATADTSAGAAYGTPSTYQSFRISFPQQLLNGSYSVILAPSINAVTGTVLPGQTGGDLIDNNLNAGLDRLRGVPVAGGATATTNYNSLAVPLNTVTASVVNGQTVQGAVVSTLVINDNYTISNATLSLNILYRNDPDLTATLTAPDGTVITLFANVGNVGPTPRANFTNTVFDDTAATLIDNGAPAFIGSFRPEMLLGNLNGKNAKGTWKLTIYNRSTTTVGQLTAWSLRLTTGQLGSGLGESVADQTTANFRIFTMDPTNATSTTTWTAVGPAGIGATGSARSSRITGMSMDNSDPTGNTVYIGGASGGIWKTSNFLTADPAGPSWIPLTDYGPTTSLNVGGIATFARNNDPRQTIVFAATGEGDTGSSGVGVLRSMDGGVSWVVLDSSTNVDAAGNQLPISSASRDHILLGSTSFKIVVDPNPTPSGQVIVYLAVSGSARQAGLWRSLDSGNTWVRVLAGQATDVTLDPNSGTLDAVSNPTGNLRNVFAALQGQGVYSSTNGGGAWSLMAGGVGGPLTRDADQPNSPPVPVANPPRTPNGAKGRIVIAKPELTGNASVDLGYQGWLYAAVATVNNHFDGLYLTTDFGQNWTAIRLPTLAGTRSDSVPIVPTNDPANPDYDPTGGGNFGQANYDLSLVVDPNHPEVVYVGGSADGNPSGLIRVDTTYLQGAHSFFLSQNNADGGQRQSYVQGPVSLKAPATPAQSNFFVNPPIRSPFDGGVQNFLRNPANPLSANATNFVTGTVGFTNTGQGVRFIPWDGAVGGTDQHRVFAFKDPLTGLSRFVFGYDQGISTAIDRGDGTFVTTLGASSTDTNPNTYVLNENGTTSDLSGALGGTVNLVQGTRNGNLQINQMYYGASQPSVNAGLAATLQGLFYFGLQDNGDPQSDPNILNNGNLQYTGPGGDGSGVATDSTGSGTVFQDKWPCCGGNTTDFFQVDGTGRTLGLIQQSGGGPVPDPQWPYVAGVNFTVNPISPNGNQIVISSTTGNIFRTENQGRTWSQIYSTPDGTQSLAMAFGAPDPTAIGYTGQTDDFIYVGSNGGHIYMTRTGGGSVPGSNNWTDISAGLDGSAVQAIVTDPTRGSGDAYAVTSTGVFRIADSRVANATWVNITGNLFQIMHNSFGNVNYSQVLAQFLTSIQADWRYFIPNNANQPNGAAHPALYVGGDAGVFRSFDNGATWTLFPDIATNGATADGGYLPNAQVTDLDLALGNINPTTGRPYDNTTGVFDSNSNPNILVASTYGRGAFAIRLAPIVSSVRLDPTLPAPGGSSGTTGPNGLPTVTFATPYIQGFSAQTAFGYKVTINLIDLTGVDPNDPVAIANAAATRIIGTGTTDAYGKFSIQINAGSFNSNGVKVIGIQAIDGSGTKGNVATTSFTLTASNLGLPNPPVAPTVSLFPADNTYTGPALPPGQYQTRVTQPRLTGRTDPNVTVFILDAGNNVVAQGTTDARGSYVIQIPTALADGTYTYYARAMNAQGFNAPPNASLTVTIISTKPLAPSLGINPADDTGVQGDGITVSRRPRLTGATTTAGVISIYQVVNGVVQSAALATTTTVAAAAPATGYTYSIQLPFDLNNGSISLVVRESDFVGNQGPFGPVSGATYSPFVLRIITVGGDYNNDGSADLAVFRPNNLTTQSPNNWYVASATSSDTLLVTSFGASDPSRDIPIQGDFNGSGRMQVAVFRPSTATWYIQGRAPIQFGQAGVDIPVQGDYDGDGVTDLAVWRPTTDTFYISNSGGGGLTVVQWGWVGHDVPVPANYSGTGKTQVAVYRAETNQWFINNGTGPITFGSANDIPVPADFNGSRFDTLAVYRPSTGEYLYKTTLTGSTVNTVNVFTGTGISVDATEVPVPRDYNGDGKIDPVVYQGSTATWIGQLSAPTGQATVILNKQFGWAGRDLAVGGPYNYKVSTNLNNNSGGIIPKGTQLFGSSSGLTSQIIRTSPSSSAPSATTTNITSTTTTGSTTTSVVNTSTAVTSPTPAAPPTTAIRVRGVVHTPTKHTAHVPSGPRKHAQAAKATKTVGHKSVVAKASHKPIA